MKTKNILLELLRKRSKTDGNCTAFRFQYAQSDSLDTCTYLELDQLSDSVACSLRDSFEVGSSIALLGLSDKQTIYGFLGALKAGMIAMVVPTVHGKKESLIANRNTIQVDGFIVEESTYVDYLKNYPATSCILNIKDLSRDLTDFELIDYPAEAIAYRQFTSSTTHALRSVLVNHEELHRWLQYSAKMQGGTFESSSLFWAPLSHSIGLYYGMFLPLFSGGHSIRLPMERLWHNAESLLDYISSADVRVAGGGISLLKLAINRTYSSQNNSTPNPSLDFSALDSLVLCGEEAGASHVMQIKEFLTNRSFGGVISNLYVSAECPAGVQTFEPGSVSNQRCSTSSNKHLSSKVATDDSIPIKPLSIYSHGELYIHNQYIAASAHNLLSAQRESLTSEKPTVPHDYLPISEQVEVLQYGVRHISSSAPTGNIDQCNTEEPVEPPPLDTASLANASREDQAKKGSSSGLLPTKNSQHNPDVAIIGLSGIFPQSNDCDEFWTNLEKGKTLISEVPLSRWDWKAITGKPDNECHITDIHWGGFIDDFDTFDSEFFGISATEAKLMDPMQRKLLETTWKALENSGIRASDLAGKRVGVFTGIGTFDYMQLTTLHKQFIHAYASTGTVHCMSANRVSFLFDFTGPSESVDTACSSSLVALHRASRSMRDGECDIAVVSGANALLCDSVYIALSNANMLSRSGLCKTFDNNADGYVRGEGVGTVVLMRLDMALQNRHSILATLKGTAVNHGGRTTSLTAPNPQSQADCIRAALSDGGLEATDVSYIEAHGTATNLGDPIEIEGLRRVFEIDRHNNKEHYSNYKCNIGSVKTNIGHLEAAAGISGLIKVLLAIKNRRIPAHINLAELNENIELSDTPFEISTETLDWNPIDCDGKPAPRTAGISSFGFGGVNAHAVVREFENENTAPQSKETDLTDSYLFPISAKTDDALLQYLILYTKFFDEYAASLHPADVQYTLTLGREQFSSRLAIVYTSIDDLDEKLQHCRDNHDFACQSGGGHIFRSQPANGSFESAPDPDSGCAITAIPNETDGKKLADIAKAWVTGKRIDWSTSKNITGLGRRIPLPTYPFARTSHWIDINKDAQAASSARQSDDYFEVIWLNQPLIQDINTEHAPCALLLLPDREQLYKEVAHAASNQNIPCYLTDYNGSLQDATVCFSPRSVDDESFTENLCSALDSIGKTHPSLDISIVDLTCLSQEPTSIDDIEPIMDAIKKSTGLTLEILKRLAKRETGSREGLSIICRHAHCLTDETINLQHSVLWGLCKTAFLELPNHFDRIIDIGKIDPTSMGQAILNELLSDSCDFEILVRPEGRYVPRLTPATIAAKQTTVIEPSGTYLVTGGLGTLGLEIADWLATRKAGRILLMSRHGIDPNDTSESTRMKTEKIKKIRASGTDVEVLLADVCDIDQLTATCTPYVTSGQLRGIFHLAGSYSNQLIENMSQKDFDLVIGAKSRGTLNLHKLAKSAPLDHFVLFSSAASVWGAATGAHYSAGNYFLDVYAEYANSHSLPVISINWGGLWEDSGIIPEAHLKSFKSIGIGTTSRAAGIAQLEELLNSGRNKTVVAPVDWDTFIPVMNARRPHLLLSNIATSQADSERHTPTVDLPSVLSEAPADDRFDISLQQVELILRETLSIPSQSALSTNKGFYEMGLDSLTSIDLKKKLESKLNVVVTTTSLFDYNTLCSLAEHIVEKYAASPSPENKTADNTNEFSSESFAASNLNTDSVLLSFDQTTEPLPHNNHHIEEQLDEMNPEELRKALENELKALQDASSESLIS